MEEITLEKIDTIRKRAGLSYAEAKSVLEINNGNVVDTLIYLEDNKKSFTDNVSDMSNDLLNTVKEIVKKGNVNRIKIKKGDKVLVDIPVNAGIAVGAISLFSPAIIAIGAVTAITSKVSIEVERPDGTVEVINDIVKNTFEQAVDTAQSTAQNIAQGFNMSKNNTCNTSNTQNVNTTQDSTQYTTNTQQENYTNDSNSDIQG